MTIDAMKAFLRRRIGGYTVAIKPMRTTNKLFRGVFCGELPSTVDRVSYPLPQFVLKPGRANRDHCSMFYGCVGAFPIFFEIHAKQGDLIALSEWTVKEPLWMHNLGYHSDALERLGAPTPDQSSQRQALTRPIANETNYNRRIRRRMSLAFTADVPEGEEYRYKETIAINELLYDRASPINTGGDVGLRGERVAGTVYPTVKLRGLADNVVLQPDFVDHYLQPKSVRYLRVEAADEKALSYSFLTIGYSETFSGKAIIWQDALEPETQRRTHVNFENGQWIFRDGSKRIYEVH